MDFCQEQRWTMWRRRCCSPRQIGLAAKRGLAPASLTRPFSSFVSRNTVWGSRRAGKVLESGELSCAN